MPSLASLDSAKSFRGPDKAINSKTKTKALKTQVKKLHRTRQVAPNWRIKDNEENLKEVPSFRRYSYQKNISNNGINIKTKGVLNSGINFPCSFDGTRFSFVDQFTGAVKILLRFHYSWIVFREFNHVTGI